jgi:hypothetical protein
VVFLIKSARWLVALCLLSSAGFAQAQYGVVEQLVLSPATLTDRSLVKVQVKGLVGSPCEIVESRLVIEGSRFVVDTSIRGNPLAICIAVVVPLDYTEVIGALAPGAYTVEARINGVASGPRVPFTVVAAAPQFSLSPPTGTYTANQLFDLAIILEREGSIASGKATLSGKNKGSAARTDISAALTQCLQQRALSQAGKVLRCPGMTSLLGVGSHTLDVSLTLNTGEVVRDTVTWTVLPVVP